MRNQYQLETLHNKWWDFLSGATKGFIHHFFTHAVVLPETYKQTLTCNIGRSGPCLNVCYDYHSDIFARHLWDPVCLKHIAVITFTGNESSIKRSHSVIQQILDKQCILGRTSHYRVWIRQMIYSSRETILRFQNNCVALNNLPRFNQRWKLSLSTMGVHPLTCSLSCWNQEAQQGYLYSKWPNTWCLTVKILLLNSQSWY